jgi:hypothetical protein
LGTMRYNVTVNKRYRHVRVYRIVKKLNETTNPLSAAFASLVEKLVSSRAKGAG